MPKLTPQKDLPKSVQNELVELLGRLSVPQIKAQLISEFLRPKTDDLADGTRVDGSNEQVSVRTVLRTVAQRRHWSLERTCLEFAAAVDLIAPGKFRRLMHEIGEPMETPSSTPAKRQRSPVLPWWDRSHGKLWVGNQVVRSIRICSTPTRIEQIITAFDRSGWEPVIAEPFAGKLGQSEMHQAVNQLNTGLQKIRFRVQKGGTEITWEVETQAKPK